MAKCVEICVESAEGAIAAWRGGAQSLEICANRAVGGLTPSWAEVEIASRAVEIPYHVLIRPRAGDFVYDSADLERMVIAIDKAKHLKAHGVVLGVLKSDHSIDPRQTATLVAHARPMIVTFHKAFDLTPDPYAALDSLIDLKIDRVLTSGQATTAREGVALLAKLLRHAAGQISIMAGGNLMLVDLTQMRSAGLYEIHAGSAAESEGRTDSECVRRLVDAWNDRVDPSSLSE